MASTESRVSCLEQTSYIWSLISGQSSFVNSYPTVSKVNR